MEERKPGLHKKVSSIFDGVQVPGKEAPPLSPPSGVDKPANDGITKDIKQDNGPSHRQDIPGTGTADKSKVPQSRPAKSVGRKEYKLSGHIPGINDKKERVKLVMIPILSVILIVVLISVFKGGPDGKNIDGDTKWISPQQNKTTKIETKNDDTEVKISWQVPKLYPDTVRDPMQTEQGKGIGKKTTGETTGEMTGDIAAVHGGETELGYYNTIVIKSILYSTHGSSVVIGNEILSEGDTVSDANAKIIKINKDNVLFEQNGVEFSLTLQPQSPSQKRDK